MCDYNPSMISGLAQAKRRHIYGMYTRPKLVSGQKYTASFYIKLANGNYLKSMLNVGLCAELAKQAPTFHIACIDTGWTLEQAENRTYDSSHDISVDNLGGFNFNNLISNPTSYRLEFANQGNTTGTGFSGSNADDNQFGLWLKFNDGQLGTYMTKIFDSPAPLAQGPTINGSTPTYRWFKIWFTFTAQDKYMGSDSNGNDIFINHTETTDRAFCFEPWVNQPMTNNFYPLFCEIAAPMLNFGTTPLKFSSQEKSNEIYSAISQTKNTIDASINNVRQGLQKVGISISAEDPKQSTIELNADVLTGNISKAKFTGDIEAKSLAVKPEGSNSLIKLVIYDPTNAEQSLIKSANESKNLGIERGTPLLIASNGTDTYLVNLTKLNSGSDGSYWKIKTFNPISQIVLYTGNTWNNDSNYITGPSNELTLYYFTDNSVEIYSHKFICESEVEVKSIGHVLYSGININKYFTSFNYNGSQNYIKIPLTSGGTKTITFNDKGYNDNFSDVITRKPNEATLESASARVSYGTYNTPVFELKNNTRNPLYRISSNNSYFSENGKTKCGITNIGNYRICRVYRRMDSGVLIDFPEKRYCIIVEKNGAKHFVGFCNYQRFLEKYTEYIDSQNPYSSSYGNQYEKQRALGEYFVKDVLYEVSLDKTISQNNNSLEACNITSCKVLFTEYEISNFEEVLNRGALAALANDYFRIVN